MPLALVMSAGVVSAQGTWNESCTNLLWAAGTGTATTVSPGGLQGYAFGCTTQCSVDIHQPGSFVYWLVSLGHPAYSNWIHSDTSPQTCIPLTGGTCDCLPQCIAVNFGHFLSQPSWALQSYQHPQNVLVLAIPDDPLLSGLEFTVQPLVYHPDANMPYSCSWGPSGSTAEFPRSNYALGARHYTTVN